MPRQIKKPIKHMEVVKEGAEFVDLASLQSVESAKIALTSLGGVELANVEEAAKKEFVTKI